MVFVFDNENKHNNYDDTIAYYDDNNVLLEDMEEYKILNNDIRKILRRLENTI